MRKQFFEDDSMLDAGIRTSNPFPVEQTPALDQRALDDLASILAAPPIAKASADESTERGEETVEESTPSNVVALGTKRKSTRRWVLGTLAAAAAAALLAVPLGSILDGATKATASPLPLTSIKPATMSTNEAVAALIEAAQMHSEPADFNPGHLTVGHWEAGSMFVPLADQYTDPVVLEDGAGTITLIEGDVDERISIPTVTETRRAKDLSGSIKQTVGDPFSITGETVKFVPFDGNQVPGSVDTIDFKPGEMQLWFKTAPSSDPTKLFDQIRKFQASNSAAVGDGSEGFVQSLGFMLTDWKPDQSQSMAMLNMLPKIKGLEFLGTSTDRWDRAVMVFGVKTPGMGGTNQTMIMFNPDTGRPIDYVEEFHVDRNDSTQDGDFIDMVGRYLAFSE